MLHSTLPRAFLPPPSLCYLGGYYGETVHPYSSVPRFVPLENAYTPLSTHQHAMSPTDFPRSVSPSPLDLSLKPRDAPSPVNEESETIEVDDVDDDYREKTYPRDWESFPPEEQVSPLPRPYPSYDDEKLKESYSSDVPEPVSPKGLRSYHQLMLTPQHHLQGIHAPMTPPSTPSPPQCPRRRPRDDEETTTPIAATPKSSTSDKAQRPKKKHARRLKFDEDTSSPVSGTVILGPDEAVVTGDIDPAFNIVEVTEEARAELAKIENRLGPYQCKLCRQLHEDAFQLAQHRCSRIAHVEYRCPECDKRFSCPANLASHRRWHKPRIPAGDPGTSAGTLGEIPCTKCDAKFSRQAALRKHLVAQHPEANNNIAIVNNNSKGLETSTLSSPKSMISSLPLAGGPASMDIA